MIDFVTNRHFIVGALVGVGLWYLYTTMRPRLSGGNGS